MLSKFTKEREKMYGIIMQKDASGKWYWTLTEQNGQILATSQAYQTKASCLRTAQKVTAKLKIKLTVEED